MHLNPSEGRKLHEDTLLDFMSGVRSVLADVSEQRRLLVDIPDDIDGIAKKREILAEVRSKTKGLTLYADLLAGAALVTKRWLGAAKLAHDAAVDGAVAEAERKAEQWLATDQPDGAFDRQSLHWPLVFPEVFDPVRPGFDAIIGNPPFLGGPKLRPTLGLAYREYLCKEIAHGVRGTNTDLIAYFALRVHALLNRSGQAGLIATNSLAQGDTREVGLDQIVASGTEIRQAIKSEPWPSRSAVIEYCAFWTSRTSIGNEAMRYLDGVPVKGITSSLEPASRAAGRPERLAANEGISHYGSDPFGMGFTLSENSARRMILDDPRNSRVLSPFLNGEDVNSKPESLASRWIINFHDWDEDESSTYHAPFDQVRRLVRPERATKSEEVRRWPWWKYWRSRPALYSAISGLRQVIVIARTSKVVMPAMVPAAQVFSNALAVFATDDTATLAFLSSAVHYWWAISQASSMRNDLRYTPADVFQTLPLPEAIAEMRELGTRLDTFRQELMLARQAGLTATYNLVHDPKCMDADISELRDIHRAIDEAVVRAYGWTDLLDSGLNHGFHDTRQGTRYTVGPAVRQEILDLLLELNHARYAAEVKAGLHNKRPRKKLMTNNSIEQSLF
jgi:Eco57I restriction-modification methylase/restriction-modification enzyme MmeI-like protein